MITMKGFIIQFTKDQISAVIRNGQGQRKECDFDEKALILCNDTFIE